METNRKPLIIVTLLGSALILIFSIYLAFLLVFYRAWLWESDGRYIVTLLFSPLIFGIGAILFISFFYFNNKHQVLSKKPLSIISTTTVLVLLITAITTRTLLTKKYEAHYSFTTEKWRAADDFDRWHFIPSLEKEHDIVGKTYSEVITLLSEPNEQTVTALTYYLGYGRGLINIDPLYYYITLNAEQIVTSAAVYQS